MGRSYRDLGLVALVVLVLSPLALFSVLFLFEDESADSVKVSLDGASWTTSVEGPLLASRTPWTPGGVRSAIVYVQNSGPAPVDADLTVSHRSTDELVAAGHLTMATQVDAAAAVPFPDGAMSTKVRIDGLPAETTVPVTVIGTFADTAPIGTRIDGTAVIVELTIKGARAEDAGAPSLLDATGPQLWLTGLVLVLVAWIGLRDRARRGAGPTSDPSR